MMKRTIIVIAISVSTLLATHTFAGSEEATGDQLRATNVSGPVVLKASDCESKGANLPPAEHVSFIKSCLAEVSSPANVKAVALQQKQAYCDKNIKNKALQGSEKESYLTACMNHNEALVQYALINRGRDADTAGTDFNKTLQQAPTGAGAK